MKQASFEARHAADWDAFQAWLDAKDSSARSVKPSAAAPPNAFRAFPARYRAICQQLALARDRQYSSDLVDRLNQLALRGHHRLYGARADAMYRTSRSAEFVARDFPRLVRSEQRLVWLACALFFGPLAMLNFVVQAWPDAAYYLLSPEQMASFQDMYSSAERPLGRRGAEADVMMFGHYIWNNIRIGFQTFATGVVFALGTVLYLVFNGATIGAVAGFLASVKLGGPFWSFVAGHSGMELTAIALSGAAGLKLGAALIAPGLRSRRQALIQAAEPAIRIMYGAAGMFLIAAFIEAFWSPHRWIGDSAKIALGVALWMAILAYFIFAGRSGRPAHAA